VEGGGAGGAHRLALDLAGRRVHPRRQIARDDRRVLCVDRRDGRGERLAGGPLEARAEQGIDDHTGALEPLWGEGLGRLARKPLEVRRRVAAQLARRRHRQHLRLAALLPQQPGSHEAVASVVALADHYPHGAGPRRLGRHARQPGARPLHEVERRHALFVDRPGVHRAHLGRLEYGVEPVGQHAHGGHRSTATAPATVSV
jgi:hypothetical protein